MKGSTEPIFRFFSQRLFSISCKYLYSFLILISKIGGLLDHSFIHSLIIVAHLSASLLTNPSKSCSATYIKASIVSNILESGLDDGLASLSANALHALIFTFRRWSLNNLKSWLNTF